MIIIFFEGFWFIKFGFGVELKNILLFNVDINVFENLFLVKMFVLKGNFECVLLCGFFFLDDF